jgi:type 1 glutamine amidotransferase
VSLPSVSVRLRPLLLAVVGVISWLAASSGIAGGAEPTPPEKKILFIGKNPDHAYGSHMYMLVSGMLGRCAELTPGVTTVVSNGWPQDAATLAGVSAIVVYTNPAAELLLEGEHRGQVDALMRAGCGLVTIHWASSVNQKNLERLGPTWLGYLGGTWVSNVGLSGGTSPLRQLIPEHPVCRGWKEWEITDEYYLNPTIGAAKPLLEVTEKNGKEVIVGWVFDRPGGGRSFATTLGHPYKNFENESFRRMIVNGILWTAGMEVPAAGAPVNVPADVLALPPAPPPAPPAAAPAVPQPAAAK